MINTQPNQIETLFILQLSTAATYGSLVLGILHRKVRNGEYCAYHSVNHLGTKVSAQIRQTVCVSDFQKYSGIVSHISCLLAFAVYST